MKLIRTYQPTRSRKYRIYYDTSQKWFIVKIQNWYFFGLIPYWKKLSRAEWWASITEKKTAYKKYSDYNSDPVCFHTYSEAFSWVVKDEQYYE